ncbi:hypothetical protein AHiyo8_16820 [Arthrobacter sp. Hiyo8]|nr:hypothetical protein AHiyo8_16820 [Arthrobacter sp. Hiyo8]
MDPTYVVEVSISNWPVVAKSTTEAQAARRMERSGTRYSSTGVGTHTTTAAARASNDKSLLSMKVGSSSALLSRSRSESRRSARCSRITARRASDTSRPRTRRPEALMASAVGRPT